MANPLDILGVLALCLGGAAADEARTGPPRLEIDPRHPFHPLLDGRHVLLLGVSDRDALVIWKSDKGFDWRRCLDELAAHGFNYVRQDVTAWTRLSDHRRYPAQFSQARWAFARTGPGLAADGLPRFDLARFDDGYFEERLVPFLREAERRRIVVELTLFDDCRSRRALAESLYADSNNVNALGLGPGYDPHSDAALGDARLLALQEAYVARVLEATRGSGSLIYEVANEAGGARWVAHFVEFIHRRRPGALVSAGEQGSAYDPVMGRCDLVVKHRGGAGAYRTDGDTARHRRSLVDLRRGGKPVLHNEFFLFARGSTADPSFVRKMLWADFTGGGHANLYDFTWWRGTGANVGEGTPSRPPPAVVRDAVRSLRRFVEEAELPFWRMEQRDELASRAGDVARAGADGPAPFVLARPGEAYAVYLVAGGTFRLDLSAQPGSLTARWFDPRAGSFEVPFKLEGGRTAELKAPGEDDWALHVAKGGAKP